jgi:hypothetical protein
LFVTESTCKREEIYPNELAYCEDRATFALIVRRGGSNGFAMMEAGLNCVVEAKERGETKKGKPVREALVVLAETGWGPIRPIEVCTAHEMQQSG